MALFQRSKIDRANHNDGGVLVECYTYDNHEDMLEDFFEAIGSPEMKGKSSKAIGLHLLVWDRKKERKND